MRSIDVPAALPLTEDMRDVAVENIELVGNMGEGVIRVRNIAFEKYIAVCFTLDKWQTTSEVTARGIRSPFPNGTMDRFIFIINWPTSFPARRRASISLSDIRFPAAKSGIITAVETTTSKSCARRCKVPLGAASGTARSRINANLIYCQFRICFPLPRPLVSVSSFLS
jgi:hypothetical protein